MGSRVMVTLGSAEIPGARPGAQGEERAHQGQGPGQHHMTGEEDPYPLHLILLWVILA